MMEIWVCDWHRSASIKQRSQQTKTNRHTSRRRHFWLLFRRCKAMRHWINGLKRFIYSLRRQFDVNNTWPVTWPGRHYCDAINQLQYSSMNEASRFCHTTKSCIVISHWTTNCFLLIKLRRQGVLSGPGGRPLFKSLARFMAPKCSDK